GNGAVVNTTGGGRFETFRDVSGERLEMRKPWKTQGLLAFSGVGGKSLYRLSRPAQSAALAPLRRQSSGVIIDGVEAREKPAFRRFSSRSRGDQARGARQDRGRGGGDAAGGGRRTRN